MGKRGTVGTPVKVAMTTWVRVLCCRRKASGRYDSAPSSHPGARSRRCINEHAAQPPTAHGYILRRQPSRANRIPLRAGKRRGNPRRSKRSALLPSRLPRQCFGAGERTATGWRLGTSTPRCSLGRVSARILDTDKSSGGRVVAGYTPEWWNGDIADAIRRARLVMADANEVRLASMECRHRAAVLCKEAEHLRAASSTRRASTLHGTGSP